jgi:ubiquinone/menaquinone biosynthesis C-methylase UbiE
VPQSEWSAVDAAVDPRRLLNGLDALRSEPFFAESKQRMGALVADIHAASVLDVGCGTGEDAAGLDPPAIGIERSVVMCKEARARHAELELIVADATAIPIRDAHLDAVRADRVLQHLPDVAAALREWRRVLQPGGRLITFDPDLATATVDGVDERAASTVLAWRVTTRPGAATLRMLQPALEASGFVEIHVEPRVLELTELGRADGIMGLATWGHAAADAGMLSRGDAQRWHEDVDISARVGTLRYRCSYLLASATAG